MRNIVKFKQKDGIIKYKLCWIDTTSDSDNIITEWVTEKEFEEFMDLSEFQEYAKIVFWPAFY
jgi:hypothetical protein